MTFHDLRRSYAVAAIRTGDVIKTVQGIKKSCNHCGYRTFPWSE